MSKVVEWRQNVRESVYCILVFSELNVLSPEMVMHIVSFLGDKYCTACDTKAEKTCGYRCMLLQCAQRYQEDLNAMYVNALIAAYEFQEEFVRQHGQ
jgi:hypothetical protein